VHLQNFGGGPLDGAGHRSVPGDGPMALTSREIYWSAILADFRLSGLTHVEFCRLRRISLHSFRKWLHHSGPDCHPKPLGPTHRPLPSPLLRRPPHLVFCRSISAPKNSPRPTTTKALPLRRCLWNWSSPPTVASSFVRASIPAVFASSWTASTGGFGQAPLPELNGDPGVREFPCQR